MNWVKSPLPTTPQTAVSDSRRHSGPRGFHTTVGCIPKRNRQPALKACCFSTSAVALLPWGAAKLNPTGNPLSCSFSIISGPAVKARRCFNSLTHYPFRRQSKPSRDQLSHPLTSMTSAHGRPSHCWLLYTPRPPTPDPLSTEAPFGTPPFFPSSGTFKYTQHSQKEN